jgi:hypothetical protein
MIILVLAIFRYMVIQPYATKFNRLLGTMVMTATGVPVSSFTGITPDQAAQVRAKIKWNIKKGIDFGLTEWQKRLHFLTANPQLKQDLKEAIEFTATTWHREARRQKP